MGQRRVTWSAIPRGLFRSGRLALSPGAVIVGLLVVTGASGYVSVVSNRSAPVAGTAHGHARVAGPLIGAAPAAGSSRARSGAMACPMIPAGSGATGAEPNGTTSSGATADGNAETVGGASHLFTRTTGDGITIRTYQLSSRGLCGCGSSSSVSVELSDQSAVGLGSLAGFPDPLPTTANVSTEPIGLASDAFGVVEGAPVWWTAVAVGPEVAKVTMTYADGSTDQMSPVDGVAVLARQIPASVAAAGDGPYEVRGTLRLLDSAGAIITTVTLPAPPPVDTPDTPAGTVPLPIARIAHPTTTVIGTSSPASGPTGSSSGSAGSSSGSALSSPPTGTGPTIVCAPLVAPAEASAG